MKLDASLWRIESGGLTATARFVPEVLPTNGKASNQHPEKWVVLFKCLRLLSKDAPPRHQATTFDDFIDHRTRTLCQPLSTPSPCVPPPPSGCSARPRA